MFRKSVALWFVIKQFFRGMEQCGRLGTSAKTFLNSSDAALTPREQGGQNLRVSVIYVLLLELGEILVPVINYFNIKYLDINILKFPPPPKGRGFHLRSF